MTLGRRRSRALEEQLEVGGADLVGWVEVESTEDLVRLLPEGLDRLTCPRGLDLDERTEVRDVVQRHPVAIDVVPVPVLLDGCDGVEAEFVEDGGHRLPVLDARLVFLSGLGRLLDERSFVGEPHPRFVPRPLPFTADTERLVGLHERPTGVVVVGVGLGEGPDVVGTQRREPLADGVVCGPDLHLDLVHGRPLRRGDHKRSRNRRPVAAGRRRGCRSPGARRDRARIDRQRRHPVGDRNVSVKGGTTLLASMSDEGEAELADDAAAGDEAAVSDEDPGTDSPAGDVEEPAADEDATADAAATEDAEESEESEDATEGLGEGDFVRLEYTIRTVEDSRVVDTTSEELAEEEGLDTEGREFEPRTLVIGAGHVFDEVEADLEGKEAGDTGTVTITAENAFGEYDPDQVRTVSADRIPEDSRHPGGHVDIDGQHGHVETIIGGRARVDFNHPLAGEDIEYEYEIVGVEEDRTEQARGLLSLYVDAGDIEMHIETDEVEETVTDDEGEETTETTEKETLYIESAPQLAMNQQWLFSKQQIASEIMERIGVDRVIVREVLDGGGMGGMFGGMGGMGGMGGGDIEGELEEALEDADVDPEEVVEEALEGEEGEVPDLDLEADVEESEE